MPTYESDTLVQTQDEDGNRTLHFPITKAENTTVEAALAISVGAADETVADVLAALAERSESAANHAESEANPHNVTAEQVGADKAGSAANAVATHNEDATAHDDIRKELAGKETSGAAAAVQGNLNAHAGNTALHTTQAEKAAWNAKSGKAESFSVTLAAGSWNGTTQTVNNSRILKAGHTYAVAPDSSNFEAYGAAMIYAENISADGSITFHCGEAPESDLLVNILRVESTGNGLVLNAGGAGGGGGGGGSSLKLATIYVETPPTKTKYTAGESFDPSGMVVKADYSLDGVVIVKGSNVTGYVYPTEGLGASVTAVTITYSEGGVVKTAEVAVSVTKTSVTIPTYSGSLVYNGKEQSAAFNNYNTTYMTASGDLKATNAGNYTAKFTLKNTDYYQWSDGTTAVKSVSWSIGKATPTLSVSPASVVLDPDHLTATATISTNSNGTLSVKSGDTSVATASLSGKTITVSHVDKASGTAQVTISQAASSNYLAATATLTVTARFTTIYGAEWDGTSTTKWSRTDAAAEFTDPVPYVAGATTYGSPFDNLMPWAGMVKSERTGGTMVAIPKFWYKLTQTGNKIKVQIADGSVEGFYPSPTHMDRGDGKGERDVVYIGRYHCAASTYKSTTGVAQACNMTRANFRTNIHKLGNTIWQNDFAMRFTLWLLYIVEFADWNSQKTIGHGCSQNNSKANNGQTDSMPYHTGTTVASRTSYGFTQYRNIEGLWDNVYDWCDGCYNNSSGLNIILNPASFSDSSGGTAVGVPTNGYPGAFSVKTTGGFPLFIPSATGGSETTYSCDYWNFGASDPCVCVGGSYGQVGNLGLFCVNYDGVSSADALIGSRLQEIP